MADIITTLHPENDENTNLYPNVKKENIPSKSINRFRLDDDVNALLDAINTLHPSGVDTSETILAFDHNRGIWVGNDTGLWYYWNGTQYVSGGQYVANVFTFDLSNINFTTGYFIRTSTGELVTNSSYSYSDFIPIVFTKLSVNFHYYSSGAGIIFYDKDKKFISGVPANGTINVDVPSNAFFFVVDRRNDVSIATINVLSSNTIDLSNLNMNVKDAYTEFNWIYGSYINSSGTLNTDNRYYYTDYIDVTSYNAISYTQYFSSNARVAVYDKDYNVLETYARDGDYGTIITKSLPFNAKYIRLSSHQDEYLIYKLYKEIYVIDYIKENRENILVDDEPITPLSKLNEPKKFSHCFNKYVCIGDSLTTGAFNTTNNVVDRRNYSYPKYLNKILNCESLNYGISGSTAKAYYDNIENNGISGIVNAHEWLNANNKGDAYIILLGTNDINQLGSFTGDVETDIDIYNYENNADTSVGQYAKIIQRVKNEISGVKVFCVTIPNDRNTTETRTAANEKIKAIASLLECYVIDLQTYAETTPQELAYFEDKYKNSSHPNALGYYLRALQITTYIDYIIENNIDDFQNIAFIGTNYNY